MYNYLLQESSHMDILLSMQQRCNLLTKLQRVRACLLVRKLVKGSEAFKADSRQF